MAWGGKFDAGPPYRALWSSPDGGYLTASVDDNGLTALLKMSALGSVVWKKTYTLAYASLSVFSPAPDGGTIMAGILNINDGAAWDSEVLLCRCSPDGEIVWQRSFATGGANYDWATAAASTSDGGIIVLGHSRPADNAMPMADIWVLKLGSTGDIEWQKLIGGAAEDEGISIRQTVDGGYLIAGRTASFDTEGQMRFWLMKLSSAGALERQLTLDHAYGTDRCLSAGPADDGSFVAALSSTPSGASTVQAVVVRIAQDGAILGERAYPSALSSISDLAMTPTADGGCLLSLNGSGNDPGDWTIDSQVMKIGFSGEIEWQKIYGSALSPDSITLLDQDAGGGFLLAGSTSSWGGLQAALWLMKTAPDGSITPNCHFIEEVHGGAADLPGTAKEVAAIVRNTAAVLRTTGLVAEAANFSFTSWGPTTLEPLGKPTSTLTMLAPESYGTTSPAWGSHVLATGISVSLNATSKTDYAFNGWTGNISYPYAAVSFVLDGDKEITAGFRYTGGPTIIDELAEHFGCFVATAAYGDPSHPDVEVLRQVRDRYLKKSRAGRAFVDLYYRYSPPVARFVAKHPVLREFSRIMLVPAVAISRALIQ